MSNYFFPIGLTVNRFSQSLAFLVSLLLSLVLSQNSAHSQCAPAAPAAPTALLVASVAPTPPTVTPISGLVAHWKFDEGTGTTACDSSGNGNNGSLVNDPLWTTGRVGNALYFDGVDDNVSVPDSNSLDLSSAFTLSAWVNPAVTLTDFRSVLVKNYKYYLYASVAGYCGNGSILAGFYEGANQPVCQASALPTNTWTHLTLTSTGSILTLYRNGIAVATGTVSGTLSPTTGTLQIGASEFGEYFKGLIDEVRIYNRALSNTEIQTIYQQESVETSQAVATSIISPNGGSFTGPVFVTMQTATSGASIYYTTNGSTPTQSSTLYTGELTLTSSTAVKAKAFKSGYTATAETTASFNITVPVRSNGVVHYADGQLSSNCTSGNYSIANRNCTGSDGNAHSGALAIQSAYNAATAGDTIYVRGYSGIYIGTGTQHSFQQRVSIPAKSGGSSSILTKIWSYNNEIHRVIGFEEGTFVHTKGIIVDCNSVLDSTGIWGFEDATLENGVSRNCGSHGALFLNRTTWLNMNVHNNGYNDNTGQPANQLHGVYTTTGTTNVFDGGEYHHNAGYGIHCYTSCGTTVIKNLRADHNDYGGVIALYDSGITIYNVVADHNGEVGVWVGGNGAVTSNISAYNNGAVDIQITDNNNQILRNSIAIPRGINAISGTTLSNNITSGTASFYFVDAANGNFQLTSPNTGVGADVSLFYD